MTARSPGLSLDTALEALQVIERSRSEAVEAATDEIYARLGHTLESFGDRGRECCREDLGRHVDYLGGSLLAGEPRLFARYVVWLRDVLSARAVPLDSLPLSVELLQAYYADGLPAEINAAVQDTLAQGIDALESGGAEVTPLGSVPDPEMYHPAYAELADALVAGNKARALQLIKQAEHEHGYLDMLVGLVQPAMYRIGDRWRMDEISVADEHLATAMAQRLARYELQDPRPDHTPKGHVLLACVESNRHAFGLRMVADAFELDGWEVGYLGPDVPTRELTKRIRRDRPDLVGLSVALIGQLPILNEAVTRIRSECGDIEPEIIAGGSGLEGIPDIANRLNVKRWHGAAGEVRSLRPDA